MGEYCCLYLNWILLFVFWVFRLDSFDFSEKGWKLQWPKNSSELQQERVLIRIPDGGIGSGVVRLNAACEVRRDGEAVDHGLASTVWP